MLYIREKQVVGNKTKYTVANTECESIYTYLTKDTLNLPVLGVRSTYTTKGFNFTANTVQNLIRLYLCKFPLDKRRQSAISANGFRYLTYRQNHSDAGAYKELTETFIGEYGNSSYNGEPTYRVDCFNISNMELIAKITSNQQ